MVYIDYDDNEEDEEKELDMQRKNIIFKHLCLFHTLSVTNNQAIQKAVCLPK
jgi:hypothetical protein